ncbi:MAG: type III pantothenate kinase [Cryomorphaceae bacterium]
MNLVIDIGNSRVKMGVFENKQLLELHLTINEELSAAISMFLGKYEISHIALAQVGRQSDDWKAAVPSKVHVLEIDQGTPTPVTTQYKTPESLGIDRICAVVGALGRFPSHPVLVIDAGTCVTYDLIEPGGIHLGGGISPGYKMRLDAMHHFTARLPLVAPTTSPSKLGIDTVSSLTFGSFYGMAHEINGLIAHFTGTYPNLVVILTGGDASIFEQHIENTIFAAPNLVLEGINSILLYNTVPE